MAGRGTDIKLGKGVAELGGLAVIGIGRMANIRQERQARGRAGRQGDPGFSRFFVSLEDDVVQSYGPSNVDKYLEGKRRIRRGRLKKIINHSQKLGEELAVLSRKQSVGYDQVLRFQRNLIYKTRDRLLDGEGVDVQRFMEIVRENIRRFITDEPALNKHAVHRYILDHISYHMGEETPETGFEDQASVERYLMKRAEQSLREQEHKVGSKKQMENFMRMAVLQAIDDGWVEQVDYLQQIQAAVAGRATAQRNVLFEFQKDALESYKKMELSVLRNIMRNILLGDVYTDAEDNLRILLP